MKHLILIVAILSFGVQGRILTAAPDTGSTGPDTLTLSEALDSCGPADTIILSPGIYQKRILLPHSGRAGNPFLLEGTAGAAIDGSGVSLSNWKDALIQADGKEHIEIRGITVKNSERAGIRLNSCRGVRVVSCTTWNTVSSGIGVWYSSRVDIDSNRVELACNDGDQECITVAECDTFSIAHNHVLNSGPGSEGGEGIDAKHSHHGSVRNNYVHHINRLGIYIDAWNAHAHSITVAGNRIHDCSSWGIALAAENGGLLQNIDVFNNICYNNDYVGIGVEGDSAWGEDTTHRIRSIRIYNNTAVANGDDLWGLGFHASLTPDVDSIFVYNNIFSENTTSQIEIEGDTAGRVLQISHNSLHGPLYGEGLNAGTEYFTEDPQFLNPQEHSYALQTTSPLKDRGSTAFFAATDISGTRRPQGDAPDPGAYEIRDGTGILAAHRQSSFYELHRRGNRLGVSSGGRNPLTLRIYSTTGRLLRKVSARGGSAELPLPSFSPGIYLLQVNRLPAQRFLIP
ncbi:MAG: right-handed parallel beta-helix repeat-containing protein [Fibrobacterota bacterium]